MKKTEEIEKKIANELKKRYDLISKYSWRYYRSEENVKVEIIEPILAVLGWEIPHIEREYAKIDFALAKKKRMWTIIEAKKLNVSSMGKNIAKQLFNYLFDEKRPNIAILTNGLEWHIVRKCGDTIKCYDSVSIEKYYEQKTISFFKLLLYDRIENIEKNAPNGKEIESWNWTKEYHERPFYIDNLKGNNKLIAGNSIKEIFASFIKQLDEWDYLYRPLPKKGEPSDLYTEKGTRLIYRVVVKKNEIPPRRKTAYPLGKGEYHVNTDKDAFEMRVAAEQIIYLMGLENIYKLVIDDNTK